MYGARACRLGLPRCGAIAVTKALSSKQYPQDRVPLPPKKEPQRSLCVPSAVKIQRHSATGLSHYALLFSVISIMIAGDKAITQQLNQSHPIKVTGWNNGLLFQAQGIEFFLYFTSVSKGSEVQHQLVKIELLRQVVTYIPLTYSHPIRSKQEPIGEVEFQVLPCPNDKLILLLDVTEKRQNSKERVLLLGEIGLQHLMNPSKNFVMNKIYLKKAQFTSAKWHPHIPYAFVVLTQQKLMIFRSELTHQGQINLQVIRDIYSFPTSLKFVDFCFTPLESPLNALSVNILTEKGNCMKVWPLLPSRTEVTEKSVSLLKNSVQFANLMENGISIEENITGKNKGTFFLECDSDGIESELLFTQNNLQTGIFYRSIEMIPAPSQIQSFLTVRTGFNEGLQRKFIDVLACEELPIENPTRILQQSLMENYCKESYRGSPVSLLNTGLLDSRIYFADQNRLYSVNLSGYLKLIATNDQSVLTAIEPYKVESIFDAEDAEVSAFAIKKQKMTVLRRENERLLFNNVIFQTMNLSKMQQQVGSLFDKIAASISRKLAEVKTETVPNEGVGQLDKLEDKDLKELKRCTESYCSWAEKKLQTEMLEMKKITERLKENAVIFKRKTAQKNKILELLTKLDNNKATIEKLISEKTASKNEKEMQISRLCGYISTIKENRVRQSEEVENRCMEEANIVLEKIMRLSKKVEERIG